MSWAPNIPSKHVATLRSSLLERCIICSQPLTPGWLARELKSVVDNGLSQWLLLVHDKRDNEAVPFGAIIGATPKELMKARGAGGIYDTVH